jgi:CRP-like cAMP-binding protein
MSLLALNANEDVPGHSASAPGCLRRASLFVNLPDAEIEFFQEASQSRHYKKGKILHIEGENADFFYVICGGWIKLFHIMPEGEEIIVDMLTTGHLVGENAVFEKGMYTSSAQVIEDVQLLSIPSHILKERIQMSPSFALAMLTSMSLHHRRHYGQIALNATQTAPQRIACFLLRLCPLDSDQGAVFHLPYDKTIIAYTLGMKGSTFSRALNILRLKTNLRIKGTCVEIDSVNALMKFVYGSLADKYSLKDMP